MELNRPEVRNCVNHETALELYRLADSNNVFAESEVQNPCILPIESHILP